MFFYVQVKQIKHSVYSILFYVMSSTNVLELYIQTGLFQVLKIRTMWILLEREEIPCLSWIVFL